MIWMFIVYVAVLAHDYDRSGVMPVDDHDLNVYDVNDLRDPKQREETWLNWLEEKQMRRTRTCTNSTFSNSKRFV